MARISTRTQRFCYSRLKKDRYGARDKKEGIVNIIQNCQPSHHYSSTQTFQFLGNKSKECVSYIKSYLDITNDSQTDGQDDIVDQTEPDREITQVKPRKAVLSLRWAPHFRLQATPQV